MKKRILWGRVFGASGGLLLTGVVAWVAAAPSPTQVERRVVGPDDCSAADVLAGGSTLHRAHDGVAEGQAPVDREAAIVVLSAARCRRVAELDSDDVFPVFTTAWHGSNWIAEHEPAPVAVQQLLDVWELAADQRRVSPEIQLAVWEGVTLGAGEHLEELLADPTLSPADRQLASRRLRGLATAPLDWDEVAAREEREVWQWFGDALASPSLELVQFPGLLVSARTQRSPLLPTLREDVANERELAGRLAGD